MAERCPPLLIDVRRIQVETLLVKSDFGVVTLVDNSPLTPDSGIVEAPMNQGNRQIAWSSAVLLPSAF